MANKIAVSGANLLFVAITSPEIEIFLYHNKDRLAKVNMIMRVGGSF